MSDENSRRITFFAKQPTVCPVCRTKFYREELLSGRGRLIAGDLTDELRRLYQPSKKFGELYPLIYRITVCPSCFYAAYPQDFSTITEEITRNLKSDTERRGKSMALIFKELDFTDFRDLREGVASYYLAIMCYEFQPREFFPSLKRGLSCLRAAWLFSDLHGKYSEENYDYLARLFYRKSSFFYRLAEERAQNGEEPLDASIHYGPDLDKNYGYDGFLYMVKLLHYKYGPRKDTEKRIKSLEEGKRTVSKLFGIGKASKTRPSPILEKARQLYENINSEIKSLQGE